MCLFCELLHSERDIDIDTHLCLIKMRYQKEGDTNQAGREGYTGEN